MTTTRRNRLRSGTSIVMPALAGISIVPDGLFAFGPVLRGSVGPRQIMGRVDQRDMREGLRIVAPSVPRKAPGRCRLSFAPYFGWRGAGGTDGSNPAPSSGESGPNRSLIGLETPVERRQRCG